MKSCAKGCVRCRRESDEFVYERRDRSRRSRTPIIAVLFNWTIQSVFLRYNYSFKTSQ